MVKILLLSTGVGEWPNTGWGACENLTYDFGWALQQEGADVKILHQQNFDTILPQILDVWKPDIVHCEYDDYIVNLLGLFAKYPKIQFLLTTHYALLSQPMKLVQVEYMFNFLTAAGAAMKNQNLTLAVLSEEIAATYKGLGSVDSSKLWVFPNGTRTDLVQYSESAAFPERAICLGKIEERKSQVQLQVCDLIDFVGPVSTDEFKIKETYKGKWNREEVYANLTRWSSLVLLSRAEAHPLVIGEALAAGCSILCSEVAAANLPKVPWIRVVSMGLLEDPVALTAAVKECCEMGVKYRAEIRAWALTNLDWRIRARTYLQKWSSPAAPAASDPISSASILSSTTGLRIALIGPGIMPIPPAGWGAVEQLIWDYAVLLREKGHHVDIINEPDRTVIVAAVNTGSYDIAHIHYDVFQDIIPRLRAKKVCVTSAYPYVDKPHLWDAGYREAFYGICKGVKEHGAYCFAMSIKDRNTFLTVGGLREDQVILMPNGVKTDSFRITDTPTLATRSVVLAKIEPRKRQHLTYWLPQVDYIGRGPFSHKNYRGELEPRERLLQLLTEFGNFVLLSDGENGTPLVVKEAMAAGLGVVLSESAANELPVLPWVTVVPEADLGNTRKLHEAIEANRAASAGFRHTIREWVQKEWDWSKLVDQYVSNLKACLEK